MMLQNSVLICGQYNWFSVEINGMRHPPSPWEHAIIREKHINAIRFRQNKLPFCWMLAYCLLWAWLVPRWSSPSKAAKLVSLCLNSLSPVLLSECWLNQTQPVPSSHLLFWSDIPSAELSPRSDWICVCIQMQNWPECDPRLNTETEMKDGLARCMTRHPSWELDLTLLPKASTDNEPLWYYAPSKTFLWVGASLDNLI